MSDLIFTSLPDMRYCFSSSSLHCDDVVRNTVVWAHDIEWVNVELLWIESIIIITLFVLLTWYIVNKNTVFQGLRIKSMNIENPPSHIFSSNIKVQGSIIRTISKETWNGHAGYGLESKSEKRKKKSYS